MSNHHRKSDPALSGQGSLFDTGMAEGALDVALGFRQCLSRAMHSCGKDRYQISAEVSRLMRRDLSKEMLDKVCGSDPAYALRAEALTALCHVIGTLDPIRYLVDPLGADVVNPEDRDLIRLARLEDQIRNLTMESNAIKAKRGMR